MVVTKVARTRQFEKDLDAVPGNIRVKTVVWINFVENLGLREVRKRPGYHDEPLHGERKGQRSVRLNRAWRLIYREVEGHIQILLLEVMKHDY